MNNLCDSKHTHTHAGKYDTDNDDSFMLTYICGQYVYTIYWLSSLLGRFVWQNGDAYIDNDWEGDDHLPDVNVLKWC